MNIDADSVTPAPGAILVRFVDDDERANEYASSSYEQSPDASVPYEGCLAQVVAVGPKVTGAKKGDFVVTDPYARRGLKVGDACIIDAYSVRGTLKQ